MKERKANEALGGIIRACELCHKSFPHRGRLFDRLGYLKASAHKKEHKDFVNRVAAFKDDFARNKIMLSMEIMEFLKGWLINHLKKIDMAYSDFLWKKELNNPLQHR
jgi:hemerythrin-like metal-binding protein